MLNISVRHSSDDVWRQRPVEHGDVLLQSGFHRFKVIMHKAKLAAEISLSTLHLGHGASICEAGAAPFRRHVEDALASVATRRSSRGHSSQSHNSWRCHLVWRLLKHRLGRLAE
jgi:hypothetical protein